MKVLSILLALVNSLIAGVVLLSCVSVSSLNQNELWWLTVRIAAGIFVILAGILIFRDGVRSLKPGVILMTGLMLVLLGTGSAMWGLHLSLISGDVKNVIILFGSSLLLQGIASVVGLREDMVSQYEQRYRD